jgi:hypothetical protein
VTPEDLNVANQMWLYAVHPIDLWAEDGWQIVPFTYRGRSVESVAYGTPNVFDRVGDRRIWREGHVYFMPLPTSGNDEAQFALAKKEDNNGVTWIASTTRLPWVEADMLEALEPGEEPLSIASEERRPRDP